MTFPKFIVEGDTLKLDEVQYHKELADDVKKVKGGGLYFYDESTKIFKFFGDSFDFGAANITDLQKCITENKVFLYKKNIESSDYTFFYKNGYENVQINNNK